MLQKYAFAKRYENHRFSYFPLYPGAEPRGILLIKIIGRILFSLIFIASGLSKIGNWDATVAYMETHHMIFITFFLVSAILLQARLLYHFKGSFWNKFLQKIINRTIFA